MPTSNPRLTITLEPTLAAQLRRLSELTGSSQSKLIAELLEGSTPVFDRLIQVLEAAERAKLTLKASTTKDLEAAQARVEGQLGLLLNDFDTMTAPLLKEAEAITRRARRRAAGAATRQGDAPAVGSRLRTSVVGTPPSNRGVRSPTPKAKAHNKG